MRLAYNEWMARWLSAIASRTPKLMESQWIAATANQPFSAGDRIYTRDNARTSLAFSGRNFARLDPNTSLDVVSLERSPHSARAAGRLGNVRRRVFTTKRIV